MHLLGRQGKIHLAQRLIEHRRIAGLGIVLLLRGDLPVLKPVHRLAQQPRPHPGKPWEYYFYAEVVGGPGDVDDLTQSLSALCRTVRVLGIYSR